MPHLFEEVRIGSITVKNRLMMPALNLRYCPGGEINERIIKFYERRAAGGVGLIVVGKFDIEEPAYGDSVCIGHDKYINGLKQLVNTLHGYGTMVAAQLAHEGRYSPSKLSGKETIAPSAVPNKRTGDIPRALTIDQIQEILDLFGQAARRAKEAGFDAVEVLGSAGLLVSQFLSPLTNLRNDGYGGSLENRMRFGLEAARRIKDAVGEDYPLLFRVSGHDFMPGGNTNAEAAQFCMALEKAGVDGFNVTGGWHESKVPQITMQVPRGAMAYLARGIKEAVYVPVIACNRITDPLLADKIIKSREADMVGLARVLVADPDWPLKAREGRYGEIRPCVGCNQGCMDETFSYRPMRCLVNAEVGEEAFSKIQAPAENKRVLIVGGGPGGLETARVAAARGHLVTLWEKDSVLGGQLNIASRAPGREEWEALRQYMVQAVKSAGVSIKMKKPVTLKDIEEADPDVLVIATGAKPVVPGIPGVEKAVQAWDVLRGTVETGRRVVVIGAGATGCETALYLARQGTISPAVMAFFARHQAEMFENLIRHLNSGTKEVTLIEAGPRAGESIGMTTRWVVLNDLAASGVKIVNEATVLQVTREGVDIIRKGMRRTLIADTVVLAAGTCSDYSLEKEVTGFTKKIYLIGDACQPRNVLEAIHEGYRTGLNI